MKIITIHAKNAIDFLNNNGIGVLSEFSSSPKIREALNGELYLEFEYSSSGKYTKYLVEENIIVSPIGYGERQAFRIDRTKKIINDSKVYIYVHAKHISYDLVDNVIEDSYVQDKNGDSALTWILGHTQYEHNFTGYSDIPIRNNARYILKNPIQAILSDDDNSFINRWGGEIVRDNFRISMLQARGEDKGVTIRYRKNLKGITFETDYSSIVTRAIPKGYDGLELPEKYVDSLLINNYIHPKISELKYDDIKLKENTEDGFDTLEECYSEMRKRVNEEYQNGLDKPTISATVDFVELSKTIQYQEYKNLEKLCIGDTVHIYIDEFDIEIAEKVISTEYDPILEKYTSFELGKPFTSYTLENKSYEKKLEETIIPNYLDIAKQNATNLLTTALGGYVVKTRNELFILDNEDMKKAQKVWRWNINGLGYSKTGINGPYETAITADGQIVADFITTGTMSVDRIQGLSNTIQKYSEVILEYDKISLLVSNTVDITKEVEEKTDLLTLNECMKGSLLELRIRGDNTIFGETEFNSNTDFNSNMNFTGQTSIIENYTDNICNLTADDCEQGAYGWKNGQKTDFTIYLRTKELFYIEDGFSQMKIKINSNYRLVNLYYYDKDKNYLGDNSSNFTSINNKYSVTVNVLENAKYFAIIFKNKETTIDSSGVDIFPEEITTINPQIQFSNKFDLGITDPLRYYEEVYENEEGNEIINKYYDEIVIQPGLVSLIKRVGVDASGNTYKLNEVIIQELDSINIYLLAGTNYIKIYNYVADIYAKYVKTNEFTKLFATQVEMNAAIEILSNQIALTIKQGGIIAAINLAIENEEGVIEIKSDLFSLISKYLTITKEGKIIATSGEIAGFEMWTDTSNNSKRSWLTKDFTDGNNKYRSGILVRDDYNTDFIFAGMPIASDGSWNTENAALRIFNNGKVFATNFEVNGENGYFIIRYNNGKTAMYFDKDSLNRYLSNGNRWSSDGIGYLNGTPYCYSFWLYDAQAFSIESGIHKTILMRISRVGNNGESACTDFYTDVKVWGNRQDGVNNSMYIQGYEVATNASDKRLKKNVYDSDYQALQAIMKMHHVSFDWDEIKEKGKALIEGHIDCGYIAQELMQLNPNYVIYNAEYDTYQLNIPYILATATKGIQELNRKVDKQQKIIDYIVDKLGYTDEINKIIGGETYN